MAAFSPTEPSPVLPGRHIPCVVGGYKMVGESISSPGPRFHVRSSYEYLVQYHLSEDSPSSPKYHVDGAFNLVDCRNLELLTRYEHVSVEYMSMFLFVFRVKTD